MKDGTVSVRPCKTSKRPCRGSMPAVDNDIRIMELVVIDSVSHGFTGFRPDPLPPIILFYLTEFLEFRYGFQETRLHLGDIGLCVLVIFLGAQAIGNELYFGGASALSQPEAEEDENQNAATNYKPS